MESEYFNTKRRKYIFLLFLIFAGVGVVTLVLILLINALSLYKTANNSEIVQQPQNTRTRSSDSEIETARKINPFCIASHLDHDEISEEDLDTQISYLKESNAGWTRFDFEVLRFVDVEGEVDFSYFDPILDKLNESEIGVIAILPQWGETATDYKGIIETPEKYAEYGELLAGYLMGKDMDFMIEIGNEPNEEGFWPGRSAEEYTSYLNSAYDAIKNVDESIQVISGGIVMFNPDREDFDEYGSESWLTGMYGAGVKSEDSAHEGEEKLHFDFFAVHVYSGNDEPKRHLEEIAALKEIIEENGDDAGVAITEIGWPTGTDDDPENVSEEKQAEQIKSFYNLITSDPFYNDFVSPVCYYSLADAGDDDTASDNWGLLDEDLNPKPGFHAFGQVIKISEKEP